MRHNMRHKHAAVIKAWADGATIQKREGPGRGLPGHWVDEPDPSWNNFWEYRVKPVTATTYLGVYSVNTSVFIDEGRGDPEALADGVDDLPLRAVLRVEIDPTTMTLVSATLEKK